MEEKVWIVVKPHSRTEKVEFIDNVWNVHVKARTENGAANSAVVKVVSRFWKKRVRIIAGFQSRKKKVAIF